VRTKFIVMVSHEVGRTVAAKNAIVSHFALQEAAGG